MILPPRNSDHQIQSNKSNNESFFIYDFIVVQLCTKFKGVFQVKTLQKRQNVHIFSTLANFIIKLF